MEKIVSQLESLLFLESKPFSFGQLAKIFGVTKEEAQEAATQLQNAYATRGSGVAVVIDENRVQLATAPQNSTFVSDYLKADATSELTRPSLETLTIVAYRGPVAKSEIELIRGVNCSLILRNLLIRGLVEQTGTTEAGSPVFAVTTDFLRHLGIISTEELPEYGELNQNVYLADLLSAQKDPDDFFQ